jgi:hypothetical protein
MFGKLFLKFAAILRPLRQNVNRKITIKSGSMKFGHTAYLGNQGLKPGGCIMGNLSSVKKPVVLPAPPNHSFESLTRVVD